MARRKQSELPETWLRPHFTGRDTQKSKLAKYVTGSLTSKQKALISELALEIFTDMANCNHTFESCLSAVYLSGMAMGAGALREDLTLVDT